MANFITRVELHKATREDYKKLRGFMEQLNFSKYVFDDKGIKYILPMAVYSSESTKDQLHVLGLAEKAATATGHKFSIIVTKSAGRAWSGLEKA